MLDALLVLTFKTEAECLVLGLSLFHLGILLMEIALGIPVSDIHVPDPAASNANP
jgi:hypothetical protein